MLSSRASLDRTELQKGRRPRQPRLWSRKGSGGPFRPRRRGMRPYRGWVRGLPFPSLSPCSTLSRSQTEKQSLNRERETPPSTRRLPGADGAPRTRCVFTYALPRPIGTERTGAYTPNTIRLYRVESLPKPRAQVRFLPGALLVRRLGKRVCGDLELSRWSCARRAVYQTSTSGTSPSSSGMRAPTEIRPQVGLSLR